MKPNSLYLAVVLSLCAPLAIAAAAQPAAAAQAAELARAQAHAAKLASEHARVAAEHAAIGAQQARHLVPEDDETPASEAEALAIAALRGLMAAPPERALPLVRKVLEGDQTARVKERAVFVLAQIEGAEAAALLKRTAQQAGQGRMRLQAVRALGIRGDADSLATLKALYPTGDADVRDAVLQSLMIANDRKGLHEIARQAKDEEEAHRAIQLLALAGGREELRALAKSGVHARNLVDAFAISDDFDGLIALARDDRDPKVQRDAVSQLGLVGDARAREALRDFYRNGAREEIRQAALQGMMIAGDEQGLLALYRAETKPERKRELLQTLTMIGGDAAFEAIDAALDGKAP